MAGFTRTATLLTIYLFLGIFGPEFGLNNSIMDVIFNQTIEEPGFISGVLSGLDFIFGIIFLPVGVLSSENEPIIIIVIEFISLLNFISLALYIRGL